MKQWAVWDEAEISFILNQTFIGEKAMLQILSNSDKTSVAMQYWSHSPPNSSKHLSLENS